jgi:NAD(P)-dependent dehydrogenase (short-subunit alcohol dehydrogenase family)
MAEEIPVMCENGGGSIVNTASILGKVGIENTADYTATKHAVIGLTKTAGLEYGPDNIRINAVCPGFTDTPLLRASEPVDEDAGAALAEQTAVNRLAEPEEIASGIKWLCSVGAAYSTGETLVIDGGYLSR